MNPEPTEAILQDATGEQADTQAKSQPNTSEPTLITPRQEMMNHIINQREQGQEETPQANSEPEAETIKVKVDGIEQEIPIDQAKATLQKNMAADKRLNDAVLKQRELQQWEQRLQQQEQQLQLPVTPPDTTKKLQVAVDALYDGDTEDAVKALSEVIGRNTATLNPEQISQQASEHVMQTLAKRQFDSDVAKANTQFHQEFADIASDPTLLNMADQKTIELMSLHADWTPSQITTEAGRQTREWVQGLTSQRSPTTRVERKQNLQSMPSTSGSVAYQPPAKNDGPKSAKEVIAAMRQSRGQA